MVRPTLTDLPAVEMPEGFGLRPIRADEGEAWVEIIRASEQFFEVKDELWERQFGFDLPEALRRVFFVTDETGLAVATAAAWYGAEEWGREWGRVHWVAVRPSHQGRGLGRTVLVHSLQLLAERGHDRAYLATSTARIPALNLYLNTGFLPHVATEADRVAWRGVSEVIQHSSLATL